MTNLVIRELNWKKLCLSNIGMLQYNDKSGNKRIKLEEIMPVVKSTSSGITSALQLVDTTSSLKIVSNSSSLR